MKLSRVLAAVAATVALSAVAFAGERGHFSSGGSAFGFFGGNHGVWANGSASAAGIANVEAGRDTKIISDSRSGTDNYNEIYGTVESHEKGGDKAARGAIGVAAGGASGSYNDIRVKGAKGSEIQSATTAGNASGVGSGFGGAIIGAGAENKAGNPKKQDD